MIPRKVVMFLLCVSVLAPIILYTDRLSSSTLRGGFGDDFPNLVKRPLADQQNRVLSEVANGQNNPRNEFLIEQGSQNDASKDSLSSGESNEDENEVAVHKSTVRMSGIRVRQMKDQLIRARVYLGLGTTQTNSHYKKELTLRIREFQRALGNASKDSDLPKNANDKFKAMEQTLRRGKQISEDTANNLRLMLQLNAESIPKGLHCLHSGLSIEYFKLDKSQRELPNNYKLENPNLYHYALFSDNVLAASVVVNSTFTNAKHPSEHVIHIVTDKMNYAAMKMWFLLNPPRFGTIQVDKVDDFTWLNSSYSPVLKQLSSQTMIDYYFKTHKSGSAPDLKYRNPKYLSILNHLRFYLPQIFPKLNKVVFLDDDIVVKKDLSALWKIDMKGRVIGVVETCSQKFHRYDQYLNFSNPIIAKNFDPRACGWAFGMNLFDLNEWRRQNITEIYHSWQNLDEDRLLWKLGTLPPGLITFYNRTIVIDRNWHVQGLGYNPDVNTREIEKAAVIHYNGNLKPWLEIGLPKFRGYWSKYVDYDQVYLSKCNIKP